MSDKTAQEVLAASKKQTEKKAQAAAPTMYVKVYAPFKTYFDGMAESISAVNDTGPFDVLPYHDNFMTLLNTCEVVVRTGTLDERLQINKGVMHVKADRVTVFLDI